jgi:predicted dehydrogenase
MHSLNRRDFLHDSAAIAAAVAAAGVATPQTVSEPTPRKGGANDQIRVAVIGLGCPPVKGGRGREHVARFAGKNNCVITTLCDCDTSDTVIGQPMKKVEAAQGKAPKFEQDLHRVMDDKSIDVVTIATPNHWHSLAAIWALQAGKHVYVEKPVSHNVSEGRRLVETARKYNKICQTGTQSRSDAGWREAMAFLHSGQLGKLKVARGLCYKPRTSIGKVDGPQKIPETINYDLWSGPAPIKPLLRKNLHYDWHWIWDYGCGDIGNQGIHEMDLARWAAQKKELPRSVMSVGGRFGYVDDGETANTQVCVYDYGDVELIFEVRGLKTDPLKTVSVGDIFYCEKGILVCPNNNNKPLIAFTNDGQVIKEFKKGDEAAHFANFVSAVRSGKHEDLNADILEGHLSSALCHLGNISYRLGKPQPFSQKAQAFGDDKEAYETFGRMEDHLRENKVPLDQTKYVVGPKLMIDPRTETFVNNKQADALLTRAYRKGYEVPAKV